MYLPELFMTKIKEGVSLKDALTICDRELKDRLGNKLESEDVVQYFFDSQSRESTERFEELMDFWEMYRDYDKQISRLEKEEQDIFILQCVYEVNGIHHGDMCQRLIEDWTRSQKENLEAICNIIEEGHIFHGKYICFLEELGEQWEEICRIGLKEFVKTPATFCYAAVRHQMIESMDRGGLAIVVAGSRGLTPQRLFGFMLGNRNYRLCTQEELECFRETVLSEPSRQAVRFFPFGDKKIFSV